jgi:hypothetical protein
MKMKNYTVTIKNINANVDKMLIAQGETKSVKISSDSPHGVITAAVKKLFNGCRYMAEGIQTSSGEYGQVTYPGAGGTQLYGRISVDVTDSASA